MSSRLDIVSEWESLNSGTPEERACFAAIGIWCGDVWLTEAEDDFVKRVRKKVHLSGYRLAEWFAWNWWRLRWEPRVREAAPTWATSHRMTTIGGGYVWPNITIYSDGERANLLAKPTKQRAEEPLRYIADFAANVRVSELEGAMDGFVDLVVGKLRSEGIRGTNLHRIWADVRAERADPDVAARRKFEALLGLDPDEADEAVISKLLADAAVLGEGAMNEVAAVRTDDGKSVTAEQLREAASTNGFDTIPSHAVQLNSDTGISLIGEDLAWKRGAKAANALRLQESLGNAPISNSRLAQMAGVSENAITDKSRAGKDLAFALYENPTVGRVVLRSKWESGRRFELARALGDRIIGGEGLLFPVTKAATYRQKSQRAFAGELLCPFDSLDDMLKGDYSVEAIDDAAGYYDVSSLTVRTLLVNYGRLDREDIRADL